MLAFADWTWDRWLVFAAPLALIVLGVLVSVLFRGTFRTRLGFARQLRNDPDIDEWLVMFDWSRKVLYAPTIAVSLVAALIMSMVEREVIPKDPTAVIVGGAWLAVFFLNFLVDEYEMSLKIIAIVLLLLLLAALWLHVLGWLIPFLRLFGRISISMSWMGYLVFAAIFAIAVGVTWLKGLFYYVAITPGYMNVQVGPTETGEQVTREDFTTRIDTSDLLERMLGFGRIVVTFRDSRRLPMVLLVGQIGRKARLLESIRGKLAVDMVHGPSQVPPG